MYDFYPYFTNDGTVGLYSPSDDDIYHSTYGALSESWQKFIIPSRLKDYLKYNDSVKILDICYGIGYNTKAALEVFVENIKNEIKIAKNIMTNNLDIAAIDADNISARIIENSESFFSEKIINFEKLLLNSSQYLDTLHTDNVSPGIYVENHHDNIKTKIIDSKKIIIDAVDINKNLTALSPFFINESKNNKFFKKHVIEKYYNNENCKNKLFQVRKISKSKITPIPKEYKLSKETLIILLNKLLEQHHDILDNPITQTILNNKNYKAFFSKFMLNLAKFYQNSGYKMTSELNKSPLLHNIYYQYISKSYKNALKLLKNNKIDINFHIDDARNYVKNSSTTYNFIFLDAFTPTKCPSLWTVHFFNELFRLLEPDGVVLTYSNSAAVRNAFLRSGFYVGKIFDKKTNKFIGTIAAKNECLIQHELSEHDLNLINSKAGIFYEDKNLNLNNAQITELRNKIVESSELVSSSQIMKGYRANEKNSV